jgi:hypothetical protein
MDNLRDIGKALHVTRTSGAAVAMAAQSNLQDMLNVVKDMQAVVHEMSSNLMALESCLTVTMESTIENITALIGVDLSLAEAPETGDTGDAPTGHAGGDTQPSGGKTAAA